MIDKAIVLQTVFGPYLEKIDLLPMLNDLNSELNQNAVLM